MYILGLFAKREVTVRASMDTALHKKLSHVVCYNLHSCSSMGEAGKALSSPPLHRQFVRFMVKKPVAGK